MPPRDRDDLTTARPTRAQDGDEGKASLVHDIAKQLESEFAQRDRLYESINTIVFLEDEVNVPSNYESTTIKTRSPLPLHIPATVTAALSVNEPTVRFAPVGMGDKGQQNATKREHFFEASWRRQQEEAERQLLRVFINALVIYGEAIFKTVERTTTAWSTYSRRAKKLRETLDHEVSRGGRSRDDADDLYHTQTEEWKRGGLPYPITSIDVDPLSFRYLKTLDGFSAICETKEIAYYDALTRYGDRAYLDKSGNVSPQAMAQPTAEWEGTASDVPKLLLTELWTWRECVYVLQGPNQVAKGTDAAKGTVVKRITHRYGSSHTKTLSRGPYFHTLGITTMSRSPHRAGMGILTPFLSLFPQLNSLLTIQGASAYLTGYPSYARTSPPGAGEPPNPWGSETPNSVGPGGGQEPIRITPGSILPFGVAPVEQPKGGVDLDKFIALLRGFIELALPSVVQGAVSGDQSGYALNQAAHLAMLAWDPLIKGTQNALSRRMGFESWLIENRVREKVYVYGSVPTEGQRRGTGRGSWLSLGPEDTNGAHVYDVLLDADTPSNKLLDQRYWEAMVKAGFCSVPYAIEQQGLNPDEVEEEQLLWEMKQDPAVRERLKQNIFEQLGLADQAALRGKPGQPDLTQLLGPDGQPMQGGPPGQPNDAMGNVMAPGMGMPGTPPPGGAVPVGPLSPMQGSAGPLGNPPGTPVAPGPPNGSIPL